MCARAARAMSPDGVNSVGANPSSHPVGEIPAGAKLCQGQGIQCASGIALRRSLAAAASTSGKHLLGQRESPG